ncbi:Nn.00g057380.m01.CDS01 [Neocucurbitaria sp. VM-36]
MAANCNTGGDCSAPNVQQRIAALLGHRQLYDTYAQHPQAGIYDRFGPEWALVIAYIESKVHQSRHAAYIFLQENAQQGRGLSGERKKARAIKTAREIALSPSPTQLFMDVYRINSGVGKEGMRAANGEMLSVYGNVGDPVPPNFGTIDRKDLEPIENFIVGWLMNPFINYIVAPPQKLWLRLMYPNKISTMDVGLEKVDGRIISTIARALVCVVAILSLAAPIATLNVVEQTKLRIIIMTLFGQVFAALAQFMGNRSLPYYTLITA